MRTDLVSVSMCVPICAGAEGHISLVGTPTLVFTGLSHKPASMSPAPGPPCSGTRLRINPAIPWGKVVHTVIYG